MTETEYNERREAIEKQGRDALRRARNAKARAAIISERDRRLSSLAFLFHTKK